MNYYCSSTVFILIVHVTIAAPPFDELYLLFDELSEINIRMGDAIKKAKDMTQAIELKTSANERDLMQNTNDVVEDDHKMATASEQMNKYDLDGSFDDDTDQNVTQQLPDWGAYDADARLKPPLAVGQVDPKINNSEHSIGDDGLDFTANQWGVWTEALSQENVTENKNVTEESNRRKFDEEQKVEQNLNKNEDNADTNTDQWDDNTNQQYEKEPNSQPVDVIEDQIEYTNKEAHDNSFGNDIDHSHDNDQEVNGEKNYNGDEIAAESDSWFGRAIDSFVSWFD